MNDKTDEIIAVIYASVDELNELMGNEHKLEKSLETVILKNGSGLDSLGFVNLISLVEQRCEEQFGKTLVLTQTDVPIGARDPFETIGTLAKHIEATLVGAQVDASES
jgi:acyl carrier protein